MGEFTGTGSPSLWGRYVAFGDKLVYTGPLFLRATAEGAKMRVWFLGVEGSLSARRGEALRGFEVAGEDRRFFPALACIDGDTILASSPSVPRPVTVRYAWATDPRLNLIDREQAGRWPGSEGTGSEGN